MSKKLKRNAEKPESRQVPDVEFKAGDPIFESALERLADWFERKQRVLPWRDEPSLYRVWVSEIMLQQTQVVTVVPYFEKFVGRFPTVEALAQSSEEEVMLHWAGLGYYSRARNLRKGALMIVERGRFPQNREEWLEIPGVGDYTAGAILSIALNLPEAILDGNVERVLSRVRRVARGAGDTVYKDQLWDLSRALVERAHQKQLQPRVINQALMELGATTCTPRKPLCVFCPLSELCFAHAEGDEEAYPPRKKPKEWLQVSEELHCVLDGLGHVLVRQRAPGEWRAGLWDLPIEKPDRRWKADRLGTLETRHVVTRHKITRTTHVWRADIGAVPLRASEAASGSGMAKAGLGELRWIRIEDPEVAVGSALKRTLQEIRERY